MKYIWIKQNQLIIWNKLLCDTLVKVWWFQNWVYLQLQLYNNTTTIPEWWIILFCILNDLYYNWEFQEDLHWIWDFIEYSKEQAIQAIKDNNWLLDNNWLFTLVEETTWMNGEVIPAQTLIIE